MTAVREAIFAMIETRLAAIPSVAEVERMPTTDPDAFPALHIFDGGQRPSDGDTGSPRYELTVAIEGYIEQEGGLGAHSAINDLYARAVAALLTEPPLNNLAETIEEGELRIDVATLASERRLGFALDLIVTFPTKRGDPAQSA